MRKMKKKPKKGRYLDKVGGGKGSKGISWKKRMKDFEKKKFWAEKEKKLKMKENRRKIWRKMKKKYAEKERL